MKCMFAILCGICCVHVSTPCHDVRISTDVDTVEARPSATHGANTTYIWRYPYNAAVLSTSGSLLGGGMIYNRRWIITAGVNAIILPASELSVRLGSDNAYKGGQSYRVEKVISHPNYTGKEWDWNVGLLKLKRNVKFGRKIKAVKLTKNSPVNNTWAIVTGWGIKQINQDDHGPTSGKNGDRLRYLVTDISDTTSCQENWSILVSPRTFCGFVPNSGPCVSDVGDPLIRKGVAVGMYVGGYYCGDDRYPDFYVDLPQYYDWIRNTIKANSQGSELRNAGVIYYKG